MRTSSKLMAGILTASVLAVGVIGASAAANASTTTAAGYSVAQAATAKPIPGPIAAVPALTGGDTAVALDAGFTGALTSLGLTPGVTGTATLVDGAVHFPITRGSIVYWDPAGSYRPYVQGLLEHDGSGLSLTAGGTTVTLSNFTVNPGNSRLYGDVAVNGAVAATQVEIFTLNGTTLKPLQLEGDNAILAGATVHISKTAADLLNQTFKTDAVKPGLLVGVATITAQIK